MSAGGAAAGASAAAAEAQRKQREEEEEMTSYGQNDLGDDWEFKILRSVTGKFKDSSVLRLALDEEARAGWVLVEKFDDQRVRLKRRASASKNDASLDFDPYRNYVGISQGKLMGIVVIAALLAVALFAVIAIFAVAK